MAKTVSMKNAPNERKADTYLLKTEAKAGNLGAVRKFITASMKKAGFSAMKTAALNVSAVEHFENLIRHAYAGEGGKAVMKIEIKHPEARLSVLDYGPLFDMRKKRIPDISKRLKNGLGGKMGIKTILSLCDRVEYRRTAGCNENVFIVNGLRRPCNPGKKSSGKGTNNGDFKRCG